MYVLALIAVNAFWLSLLFAFVPIMCMRALAKAQQECMRSEGWNFFKMLEKWHSGYTAPLELNWVPKTTGGLAAALIIATIWSIAVLIWGSNEIYLSTINSKWPTNEGRITTIEKLPSTSTSKGLAMIDFVTYEAPVNGNGLTVLDDNVVRVSHAVGDHVTVAYDPENHMRSTLTPGSQSALEHAAVLALLMPVVTLLCVLYTAVNFRSLIRLREAWDEDAARLD